MNTRVIGSIAPLSGREPPPLFSGALPPANITTQSDLQKAHPNRRDTLFLIEKDATGNKIDYFAAVRGQLQLIPAGESLVALEKDYASNTGGWSAAAESAELCRQHRTVPHHSGRGQSAGHAWVTLQGTGIAGRTGKKLKQSY